MAGGKPVQVARLGSKIDLHAVAKDTNGDQLAYRWLLPDGKVIGPTGDSQLSWEVPVRRGNYPITVVVGDQYGGYTRSGLVIEAATTGAALTHNISQRYLDARVEVNTTSLTPVMSPL